MNESVFDFRVKARKIEGQNELFLNRQSQRISKGKLSHTFVSSDSWN